LNNKAVPVDAKHKDGTLEFEAHSTFGHLEGIATKQYFENKGQRAFILSRSTILGSAKYIQHWLGDNWSTFQYMKASVAGIFNFNFFGFPLVGADICGFLGDTEADLCTRWYQLGAFYPFSRNHNDIHSKDQYPYIFDADHSSAIKDAMVLRYKIHAYMYTLMQQASQNGIPVFRPQFYDF